MIRLAVSIVCAAVVLVCGASARAASAAMRVAVMEFTTATSDASLEPLGKGLQSMVTTDLANVQSLTVVERERLKDIQSELKLAHGKAFDKATAAQIGKLAGASHLFVGSFTVVGDSMRLDGRLIAVGSGEVLAAEQIAGEKALFFELEQKLVQKIIALLGVKLQPKERAALARPHTADFQAFQKFSEGIQAFDDGHLEEAMKALNEATAIDKDFKLASLTLEEYEKLASQVRTKASAAGRVEDEMRHLEKNKAIAAEVAVLRKLWPIVDLKGTTPEAKLKRVAAECVLVNAYRSQLGFRSRGPVSGEDLAAAGFDDFSLERTADALFARAWSEAPDVFPRVPPLCSGFGVISSDSTKDIDTLLGYEIQNAAKLAANHEALLSYMSNNAHVDPAADALQLDPPGVVKLWEKLYALAQKLPDLDDDSRAHYESMLGEWRRRAGDFDGSTQMFAAASHHTKDSHRLGEFAKDIDKNKKLKLLVGPGAPALLHELYLLRPESYDLERLAEPAQQKRLAQAVQSGRDISEREKIFFGDLPTWRLVAPSFQVTTRSGPRTSILRADELRYEGRLESSRGTEKPPSSPVIFLTSQRGRRMTVRASIDQSAPPADWRPDAKTPVSGGGEAGIVFAGNRVVPQGSLHPGAPGVTIAWAVVLGNDRVRLVQIQRDGDHKILVRDVADGAVGPARGGRRAVEVKVDSDTVTATVDGKKVTLPWKPDGDADGFVGFMFSGIGYASIAQPVVTAQGGGR